jgi:PAS domain S-box-containing protein
LTVSQQAMTTAFAAEQVHLHRAIAATSAAASALLGIVLATVMWPRVDSSLLLTWLLGLVLALGLRLGVAWADQRHARTAEPRPIAWLWRYRTGFAVHGAVWGLAGLLLLPTAGSAEFNLLAFAFFAIAAGSLLATAFDTVAASLFVAPALAPLIAYLAARHEQSAAAVGVMVILFLVIAFLSARRTERSVRETVRLRLAEAERAEQAGQVQRTLTEQHHLLYLLLQTTRQGFWFTDNDGVMRDVNPVLCALLGRPREQLIGHSVYEFFDGNDLQVMREQGEARRRGEACVYELGITRPDGSRLQCVNNATPIYDTQGQPQGSIGLIVDITQQRHAEAALRTYEIAVNSITDMVSVVGEDLIYRMVNDEWCRCLGVARADAIGRTTRNVVPTLPSEERRRALQECIDLQQVRVVRGSFGAPAMAGRHYETTYYPYAEAAGGVRSVVMVTRDISAEVRALAALQASESDHRALLDAFPGFITRVDADLVYTFVNRQAAARLGTTAEQMVGRSVRDVVGAERETWLRGFVERALAGEEVTYERHHAAANTGGATDQVTLAVGVDPRTGGPTIYAFGVDISDRKRTEQQLHATSEQLRQRTQELQFTLDSIAQGIVSIDAEGRIGVYNQRALELLDLPESLLKSRATYDEIVRYQVQRGDLAEDASFIDADGRRRFFSGGRVNSPEVYVRRTRSGALVEVRTRQLAGGSLVRTFADVTAYVEAQQALRDRQAELRALLDAFPGFIAAIDERHTYTYVNHRFMELLGRSAQQTIGRHVREVLGDERFRSIAQEVERARTGEPAVGERSYGNSGDGTRRDLEVHHVLGAMGEDGRQTCYVFGLDITARKRAEEALIVARDEAERANRAKSQFLSHMSHELRTPMNAILGFGQLLESDIRHPLAAAQQRQVHEILRSARHLLDLINEMLDLGRIEAGELPVERVPVRLADLIDDCLGMVRPLAQAHGVTLLAPAPALLDEQVWADRTRLKQVLLNLLANAIKYNRPGGEVAITCSPEIVGDGVGDSGALRIAVRDSGRGLTADEQQRLFQPFERLSASQTDIEGTGIGLALSQRLVHAMGGTIGVHSEAGRGSTFWVRLSRADAAAAPPAGAPPGARALAPWPANGAQRSVLYIEDNPVNVILMQAMLARLDGVRTVVAPLPLQGLEFALRERPDLVLLDIQLPGMDGFEVLRRLRANPRTQAIPVIAVSANAMQADIEAGHAAGFTAYLTKPIELELLLATVYRVLHTPITGQL